MEIVRFTKFLRLSIFSVFSALAVAACGPEESNGSENDSRSGSNALTIEPPADRLSEATGLRTIVSPGQANATGGAGAYTFTHDAPANGFPLGTTLVTWTVVDGNGARSTAE